MAQSVNQELIANLKPFIVRTVQRMNLGTGSGSTGNLLSSGVISMDAGYTPDAAQKIATKKYVDDSIPTLPTFPSTIGNLLSNGHIPMDVGYVPSSAQSIATRKYVDDHIVSESKWISKTLVAGEQVIRANSPALNSHAFIELSTHRVVRIGPRLNVPDVYVGQDLDVKRSTTLRGTSIFYGVADARSTMRVRGAFTTDRTAVIGGVLTANSNAVVKGTLAVTRGATLSSTLRVHGVLTADTDVKAGRDLTIERYLLAKQNVHMVQGLTVGVSATTPMPGEIIVTKNSVSSAFTGAAISARAIGLTGLSTLAMSANNAYFEVHSFNKWGGAWLGGASMTQYGIWLTGHARTTNNVSGRTASAPVMIAGVLAGGGSVGGTNNLAVFKTGNDASVIVKGNGALWSRGGSAIHPFDDEDDNALLRGYSLSKINPVREQWNKFVRSNVQRLEELNLVKGDFVNMNGMIELQIGAIGQINNRVTELEKLSITDMIKILFSRILRIS